MARKCSVCNPAGCDETCSRTTSSASEVGLWSVAEDFWSRRDVIEAIQRRDFGMLIRCYRTHFSPPISQLEVSTALSVSQGQVSRIESGKTTINDLEKLTRWSRALGFPDKHLWFDFPSLGVSTQSEAPSASIRFSFGGPPTSPAAETASAPKRSSAQGVAASTRTHHVINGDDISILLETIRAFRQLDNKFGGGHVRTAVAAYLADEVEPALRVGRFGRGARKEFQRASVELNQLVGWMAYDVGDDTGGRRHLRRALDISSQVGDSALSAEMLAAVSHQAAYAGRAEEAVDFAIGAKQSALRSGVPALQAESAALEAQGYAIQQDSQQCLSALRRAERAFSQVSSGNTPPWLRYFDRAYMSAKFAHALRELGRPLEAETFARESLLMCDGYERGRLFNTALLAGILADRGQLDEAASCAGHAVRMANQVRSFRAWRYLDDVRIQLYPFRKTGEISEIWPELAALQPYGFGATLGQ